jgi:hypothetical protein
MIKEKGVIPTGRDNPKTRARNHPALHLLTIQDSFRGWVSSVTPHLILTLFLVRARNGLTGIDSVGAGV